MAQVKPHHPYPSTRSVLTLIFPSCAFRICCLWRTGTLQCLF